VRGWYLVGLREDPVGRHGHARGQRGHAGGGAACPGPGRLLWLARHGAAADPGALPWDRAFRPAAPYL